MASWGKKYQGGKRDEDDDSNDFDLDDDFTDSPSQSGGKTTA